MIIACPHCDSIVPINQEIALGLTANLLACPACEVPFNPSEVPAESIDERINNITLELLNEASIKKRNNTICIDC